MLFNRGSYSFFLVLEGTLPVSLVLITFLKNICSFLFLYAHSPVFNPLPLKPVVGHRLSSAFLFLQFWHFKRNISLKVAENIPQNRCQVNRFPWYALGVIPRARRGKLLTQSYHDLVTVNVPSHTHVEYTRPIWKKVFFPDIRYVAIFR